VTGQHQHVTGARRAGRARRGGRGGAGAGAAALLTAAFLAASAGAATPARADGSTPPAVGQTLPDGQGCVSGSTVTDPATPWQVRALAADRVAELGAPRPVTVALLDTGVALHRTPQLTGRVFAGPRISGPAGKDCVGHGTFVAGLIAAGPRGGTGAVGLDPAARIYSLAVTDATGATTPTALAHGITAALAAHAEVIDVSVVTTKPAAVLAHAVRAAIAAGALVVAPATADGQSQPGAVYPAAYPGVLSVAPTGASGALPSSERLGAPVDLVAPGDAVTGPGLSGGLFRGSGASYAAAYVAGAAALVDSYRGPAAPAALIHRLEATAVRPGTAVPDPGSGWGALDPYAAMSELLPEEAGASAAPGAAAPGHPITVAARPRHAARNAGVTVAAAALAVLLAVAAISATAIRGRRRGWRPGTAKRVPPALP
jgi:hypothetical protein